MKGEGKNMQWLVSRKISGRKYEKKRKKMLTHLWRVDLLGNSGSSTQNVLLSEKPFGSFSKVQKEKEKAGQNEEKAEKKMEGKGIQNQPITGGNAPKKIPMVKIEEEKNSHMDKLIASGQKKAERNLVKQDNKGNGTNGRRNISKAPRNQQGW